MHEVDLVIRSSRVVTSAGESAASVVVKDGRIVAIAERSATVAASEDLDLRDEVLMPGLVDSHVHIGEPGRTEFEGFATATRAAAAGGVTTLLVMPIGSVPPTVDVAALEEKRRVAAGQCHVDVGFWGGAVAGNRAQLGPLFDAGVFGFKCFLTSQAAEFPPLLPAELHAVLNDLKAMGALLVAHAEDEAVMAKVPRPNGSRYRDYLQSSPQQAETVAITRLVEGARLSGGRVHVVHLSAAAALPVIDAARHDGVAITAETCPHYLSFSAEDIPDGATLFKCSPPVREDANREALWRALADGVVECIVSDHAACTAGEKHLDSGDFGAAWPGISSLQLGLSAVWTEASERGHALSDIARWMAEAPAQLVGLRRKGAIAVGNDADLVWFAPDETFVVDPATLMHRNPITAYAGRQLKGLVRATWLRGKRVGGNPAGRQLRRGEA
ncbi:allantoinase AllB [Streptomyces sp. NPDC056165]|uniref:allantoinase AllB n=1 Tax=Streptomyces sp. NPDC056165 TaxID=3345733 RepID=UPI0035DBAA98